MVDVLIDALIDSFKVLLIASLIYILIAFLEKKLSSKILKKKKFNPFFGALIGLLPQCGFSVVASDMYLKRHITMGTLVAVFIACSDEAFMIFLTSASKAIMIVPLLIIKLILGFIVGFTIDYFSLKERKEVHDHHECCTHEEEIHVGCCNHKIEEEHHNIFIEYFLHPLIHSLKIWVYVLIANIFFGTLVYFIGEQNIALFLQKSKHVTPLFSTLVGLIPNCASSVLISNMYLNDYLSFGACLSGLIANSGLGLIFLFKEKSNIKNNLKILGIITITALVAGYIFNYLF